MDDPESGQISCPVCVIFVWGKRGDNSISQTLVPGGVLS